MLDYSLTSEPGDMPTNEIFVMTSKCNVRQVNLTILAAASTTRGLMATDHVILNHGQVTWTTPELSPPLLTTTPHQWEDVSALDKFNVHRCPTRRVFSGTGLELMTRQATIRYLYHSATATTEVYGKVKNVMICWFNENHSFFKSYPKTETFYSAFACNIFHWWLPVAHIKERFLGIRSPIDFDSPELWQACHEFDPSTTKDPPCRAAMHVKSVES
ncbi:uncharacterized protein TNCV_4775301 [Trichonephila clavipes]|nr:uncharacterized protein TNCV_4775301 [Trichonephila clavipes]